MHRVRPVAHGHDGVVFLRPGSDFELARHVVVRDHERVIAARLEWRGDPREHALAVVNDGGGLAVHRRLRAAHDAAVDNADRLVPEADAEQRDRRAEAPDDVDRDPRVFRTPRAGRDDDLLRRHRADLVERHFVVAPHADLRAQLAQILHEVVGKRIVVVDDENHYKPACASSSARITARALSRVSSYSAAGFESATMPAPAWTYACPSSMSTVRMVMQKSRLPAKSR